MSPTLNVPEQRPEVSYQPYWYRVLAREFTGKPLGPILRELEGCSHPDFVATYWPGFVVGESVAVDLVLGALWLGRERATATRYRDAHGRQSRRDDYSFRPDTASDAYEGWTFR